MMVNFTKSCYCCLTYICYCVRSPEEGQDHTKLNSNLRSHAPRPALSRKGGQGQTIYTLTSFNATSTIAPLQLVSITSSSIVPGVSVRRWGWACWSYAKQGGGGSGARYRVGCCVRSR